MSENIVVSRCSTDSLDSDMILTSYLVETKVGAYFINASENEHGGLCECCVDMLDEDTSKRLRRFIDHYGEIFFDGSKPDAESVLESIFIDVARDGSAEEIADAKAASAEAMLSAALDEIAKYEQALVRDVTPVAECSCSATVSSELELA